MKTSITNKHTPTAVGIGFLLFLTLAEYLTIMILNNGFFVYTLDDPYIHMALAENILKGHYGVNLIEFSAPSSSIIWPFIIAPFSNCEKFPFLVNIISAIVTVIIFVQILKITIGFSRGHSKNNFLISLFIISLILATNIVGLIFTGMEHSLQVLAVVLIVYGMILDIERNKVKFWFLIALMVAPLIRYENMAISIAALGYFAMRRYFKYSVLVMLCLLIFIGGFSLFLLLHGAGLFPNSIVVKSSIVESGGELWSIYGNIKDSLHNRQGVLLWLSLLIMLFYGLFAESIKKRQFAIASALAVFLHFIAGEYGGYNRYEIYIWTVALLVVLYLLGPHLKRVLVDRRSNSVVLASVSAYIAFVFGAPYLYGLVTIPIAANNIYEQQYQMHRFAADYYKMPIAVNDLGYVAYKNDNYVLDLWGLAFSKSLDCRKNNHNKNWMMELTDQNNIELAMIYEAWFKNIPNKWQKIGELHLGKKRITPAQNVVSFYATNKNSCFRIAEQLQTFVKTLPADVKFIFQEEG